MARKKFFQIRKKSRKTGILIKLEKIEIMKSSHAIEAWAIHYRAL